jgi:hypothetical protein
MKNEELVLTRGTGKVSELFNQGEMGTNMARTVGQVMPTESPAQLMRAENDRRAIEAKRMKDGDPDTNEGVIGKKELDRAREILGGIKSVIE